MTSGISRFGGPRAVVCNLGTTGTLPNHSPGQAYSGTFQVTNPVGNVTAELVSASPALPTGWTLTVGATTSLGVVSHLRFNGTNGSTTFTDETGKTWTPTGTPTITTSVANSFDGACGAFGTGSTDRIDCTSTDFNFGTGDFTIEGWFNLVGNTALFSFGGHLVYLAGVSPTYFFSGANRISFTSPPGPPTAKNPFSHVALVREAGVFHLFVNGTRSSTSFTDTSAINAGAMRIGWFNSSFGATPNYDEFRVVRSAVYSGPTYTVPTAPFTNGGSSTGVTLAWPAATPSGALANLNFELGNDGNWLLGNRWTIDTTALVETGTQSAKYDGPGQSSLTHAQAVPVTPGTSITASARISKGTTRQDFSGGAVVLSWLNAAGTPISFSVGNVVNTGSSAFQTSTVTAIAPAGAALVRLAVSGSRDPKGRSSDKVYVDNVSWSHSYAIGGGAATNYAVVIRVRDGRGCQATLSQTVVASAGPGAHRYWRVQYLNIASTSGLSELRMFDALGVNRTQPNSGEAPAIAGSFVNSPNRPWLAFDGNTTGTGWISGASADPTTRWIGWDFGATGAQAPLGPVEIKTIEIFPSWNSPVSNPEDFEVQWSDDGISWTTALTVLDEVGWVIGTGRTFTIF